MTGWVNLSEVNLGDEKPTSNTEGHQSPSTGGVIAPKPEHPRQNDGNRPVKRLRDLVSDLNPAQ